MNVRPTTPRLLLRFEGLAVLALAVLAFSAFVGDWWLFAVFFLAPDLAFVALLFGRQSAAAAYNALHTYAGPAILLGIHLLANQPLLLTLGLIWSAHIGADRAIGYGLKYSVAKADTHLDRA